jgi:hypothetical protein
MPSWCVYGCRWDCTRVYVAVYVCRDQNKSLRFQRNEGSNYWNRQDIPNDITENVPLDDHDCGYKQQSRDVSEAVGVVRRVRTRRMDI